MTLLDTEFIKHINAPIRVGYPSVGFASEALQTAQTAYNVIQQKKTGIEGPEKQKTAFLVALNNIRVSIESIISLKVSVQEDVRRSLGQVSAVFV